MNDVAILQTIRVKGLTTAAALAASLGLDEGALAERLAQFSADGLLGEIAGRVRLSPAGREHLAVLVAAERQGMDDAAMQGAYDDFCGVNDELKATVAAWQMKDAQTPNDHADPAYDAAVLARLVAAHGDFLPVGVRLAGLCARLSRYTDRLEAALARIAAGEMDYVAKPIIDSYHTVWFELHEDLLALTGRTRAEEAAAGRAA